MKGDFSRGFNPDAKRGQRYRRVLLQQGRLLLDSDFAAAVDALAEDTRRAVRGLGCRAGSPDLGFLVTPGRLLGVYPNDDGVTVLAGQPEVWSDFRPEARYLGRYPGLRIGVPAPDDGTGTSARVRLPIRRRIAVNSSVQVVVWVRVERPTDVRIQGHAIHASGSGYRQVEVEVSSATDGIEIGVDPGSAVWIGMIEQLEDAAPTRGMFWIAAGTYHVDGLVVQQTEDRSFPAQPFPARTKPLVGAVPANSELRLAYLEVWERHITHVEDPGIREGALGGVDTTTRTRLEAQVKMAAVQDLTPGTDGWVASARRAFSKIVPSGGRLIVRVPAVVPTTDPCALPQARGYAGADNRLYRFEVHRGGTSEDVLVKWSRDNGSELFACSVDSQNRLVLPVETSLAAGDIVEVLAETIELGDAVVARLYADRFSPAQRQVGQLAMLAEESTSTSSNQVVFRLVDLDDASTSVALDTAPLRDATSTTPLGSVKLRRWHGVLRPSAQTGPHAVEDGIEVEFSASSNNRRYLPGQWWQYEARADRDNANGKWQPRPHGPERLFAPLALLRFHGNNAPFELVAWLDERFPRACEATADDATYDGERVGSEASTVQEALDELFSRDPVVVNGCGEIIVRPESDLQAVFDSIGEGQDARVCIHPGEWRVRETVVVTGKGHLMVSGAGAGTRIVSTSLDHVLRFEGCASVRLHDVSVQARTSVAGGDGLAGVVALVDCGEVDLERVRVVTGTATRRSVSGIAIVSRNGETGARVRVHGCNVRVGNAQTGILVVDPASAEIEDNHLECPEQPWSLRDAHDEALAWVGGSMMGRFALYPAQRFDSDLFLGDSVVVLGNDTLEAAGLPPDSTGRPRLAVDMYEWNVGSKVLTFTVHPSLADPVMWRTVLERNPMTGWNNFDSAGRRRAHPDGWVLANLRRLRRGIARAAFGLASPVDFRGVGGRFVDLAERLEASGSVTAGGQGIVVAGRRTPQVGDAFNQRRWNTLYVSAPRSPSVTITGNRVLGFTQGIHVGTSHNKGSQDRRRRLRSYRVRIHGNTVHLRVSEMARERHGIFVGNAQSVLVTDNMVELTHPAIERWDELPALDGIRLWGSFGPLLQVRGNHTVGVPTGIRVQALNPHEAGNSGVSWRVESNAYAGLGAAKLVVPSTI